MKSSHAINPLLLVKIAAGVLLFSCAMVFTVMFAEPAEAKGARVYQTHYDCRTGWWMVRDGSRYSYPSDGKWRPSWHTRCRKVIVHISN